MCPAGVQWEPSQWNGISNIPFYHLPTPRNGGLDWDGLGGQLVQHQSSVHGEDWHRSGALGH